MTRRDSEIFFGDLNLTFVYISRLFIFLSHRNVRLDNEILSYFREGKKEKVNATSVDVCSARRHDDWSVPVRSNIHIDTNSDTQTACEAAR